VISNKDITAHKHPKTSYIRPYPAIAGHEKSIFPSTISTFPIPIRPDSSVSANRICPDWHPVAAQLYMGIFSYSPGFIKRSLPMVCTGGI